MSSEIAVNHHPQQEQQRNHPQQSQQLEQHLSNQESQPRTIVPGPSPRTSTMATTSSNNHPAQGLSSAVTTATAAQAAAAAAAAGRDMKNFSDLEINELLGLIPDEYTAEQQAEEAAAATAAANAAAALGKGVHHSVTVTTASVPSSSTAGSTGRVSGIRRISSSNTDEGQQQNGGTTGAATTAEQKAQDAHIAAQEAQLRSERKRSREKQRRNDVNKQFAELTEVLKNIEREAQEVGRNDDAYGSVSTMMAIAASTGPTNRVDLIARTIVHLERLNRTAKKQRSEIASLREQLEHTKKAGEEMAEKLKDVMFNQQRQYTSAAYAPFPQLAPSSGQVAPASAAPAPGMSSMPTTGGLPQQQHLQQQVSSSKFFHLDPSARVVAS